MASAAEQRQPPIEPYRKGLASSMKILHRLPIALALAALLPTAALADSGSGSFTDAKGLNCNWNAFGITATVECSGYVQVSRNYSCMLIGSTWNCDSAPYRIGY